MKRKHGLGVHICPQEFRAYWFILQTDEDGKGTITWLGEIPPQYRKGHKDAGPSEVAPERALPPALG